jgi:hypothetical protein
VPTPLSEAPHVEPKRGSSCQAAGSFLPQLLCPMRWEPWERVGRPRDVLEDVR